MIRWLERRLPGLAATVRSARARRAREAQPLVETPWGFKFAGATPDLSDPVERAHVHSIETLIDEADVFVDVGANIGFFSCLARSHGRSVVAVEPFPVNVESVVRNCEANGWRDVDIHRAALADREGTGVLYGRDTLASRVEGWAIADDPWRQNVVLTTLDAVIGARFERQSVAIKVDVEGGEFDLLRGASATLDRTPAPVWSVEISLTENHPGGRNPHFIDTFELFFSRGYTARTIGDEGVRDVSPEDVTAWAAAGRRGFGSMNYLFSRTG